MDFSKLNIEFANMQKTITKYNQMNSLIHSKIKDNLKIIGKYETKIKNTKNKIEKDIAHLYITVLKEENDFLNNLTESEYEGGNENA